MEDAQALPGGGGTLGASGGVVAPSSVSLGTHPVRRRRPYCRCLRERRSKVYGVAEYLMVLQEAVKARLNRQARKAH
jgi:hypothetical protein